MGHVPGAKTYHMIHQSAWRNPIVMSAWERRFLSLHPMRAVALLNIFWGTLADAEKIPPEFRIYDLIELESAAINRRKLNYDEARGALGLESLGSAFWLAGIG